MKTIEILEEFRKRPFFTVNDLAKLLRKSREYVKVVAYRLHERGLIKKIERGKYTVHEDPLVFASYITAPSYISFWTALRFYSMTEQLPSGVMVAVTKPKKEVVFDTEKITFTKVSEFWGYTKMRYRDFDIFIAEPEKAVIDCMLAKNVPFDEAAKAILECEYDTEKMLEYARKTKNSSLVKRIGYLVERRHKDASSLLDIRDSNYIVLDWSGGRKGAKDARWKVIVNRGLDEL